MSNITHNGMFRKALVMLLISTMTATSVTSISMIDDAEASRAGLKVLVNGGEGEVCVKSNNEDAGCEFADGGTLEFEFSSGAVEVGDRFEACDDNGCKSGRNGEEKEPERISLGGGSGESSDGDFGGSGESSDGDFGGSTGNEPNNRGTDWTNMCNTVQVALYSSCDELVNNDGSLTSQGQHALGCIRNGALLAAGAGLLSGFGVPVSPGMIIGGLNALEEPTGCGGIVKMDMLNSIGGLGSILSLL